MCTLKQIVFYGVKSPVTGCLQLEISWNLKSLLEILEFY